MRCIFGCSILLVYGYNVHIVRSLIIIVNMMIADHIEVENTNNYKWFKINRIVVSSYQI